MKFEFTLGPPRVLPAALLLAHGGAVIAAFLAAIPLPFKIAVLAVLCASLAWQLRLLGGGMSVAIEEDGACRIAGTDGEHVGQVADDSFVSSTLVILNIQAARTKSIVITAERLDADTFRRLRVFLRWGMRQDALCDAANMKSPSPDEKA